MNQKPSIRELVRFKIPNDICAALTDEQIMRLIDAFESAGRVRSVDIQSALEAYPTIPEQIRAARKEAGLTQVELAEKLGVSLRTIENWEAGVRQPRYKHGNILERILSFKKSE